MATKLPGRAFGHDHVDTQESCKQLTHTLPRVRSGRFKLLGLIKHHAYLRLLKNRSTLVGKAVALSRCASVNRTRRPTSPAHRSRVSPATQPHRQRAPVVGAATHSASAQLTSAWLAAGWEVLPVSHGQVACCRWLPGLPFEVRRAWSIVAVISPPAAPSRCRAEAVPRSSTSPPPPCSTRARAFCRFQWLTRVWSATFISVLTVERISLAARSRRAVPVVRPTC